MFTGNDRHISGKRLAVRLSILSDVDAKYCPSKMADRVPSINPPTHRLPASLHILQNDERHSQAVSYAQWAESGLYEEL